MVLITADQLQALYDGLDDGTVEDFSVHLGILTRADGTHCLVETEQMSPIDVSHPITKVAAPSLSPTNTDPITYENHPLHYMGDLFSKVFPNAKSLLDYIEKLYIINGVTGFTRTSTSISAHQIEDFKPQEAHLHIYPYLGFENHCHLWIPLVSMTKPMQILLLSWFASIGKPRSCIADYIENYTVTSLQSRISEIPKYVLSESGESFTHNSATYPFYRFQNDCRAAYGLLPGMDLIVNLDMRKLKDAIATKLSTTKYVRLDDALLAVVDLITKYNFRHYYKQLIVIYGRVTEALVAMGLTVEMQHIDVIDIITRCVE